MDSKSYIKSLLVLNKMSVKVLAEKMTKLSGKKYTDNSIYGKLNRDTLSFSEVKLIAKILGYKIEFTKE